MQVPDNWNEQRERIADSMPVLKIRSRLLTSVRRFFDGRGFVEVETPVRVSAPALEEHIDAEPAGSMYLRTSPELEMKKLLAAGLQKVFQIGPCFRSGERGRLHNPEYTMLEWYRANADYNDVLVDTKALMSCLAKELLCGRQLANGAEGIELDGPWDRLTVADAFVLNAGWNPVKHFDAGRFDSDMALKVEPRLTGPRPIVLADYPAGAAALARLKPGNNSVAERWELYIGGIEIANAFSELTDPDEQRARFLACADVRRSNGREAYPVDDAFLAALKDMPPSAGVALGIDRLVMLFSGVTSLDQVLPFRRPVV